MVPARLFGKGSGVTDATSTETERSRLTALHALKVLDTPAEEIFDGIARAAAEVCGTRMAMVSLIDRDRQWFKAAVGLGLVRETPREHAFCDHAIRQPEVFEIRDAAEDQRFSANPYVTGPPHIRFYAGAPLTLEDGSRVGTLCVVDDRPGAVSSTGRAVLSELARVVTQLLEQRRHVARSVASLSKSLAEAEAFGTARTQFLGTISHELRTPLNAIIGFADILRQQFYGPLSERYQEAAGLIHSSGEQMLCMVNDLLDLSRIDLHAVSIDPRPTDLRYVAGQVIRSVTAIADARRVRILADLPESLALRTDERVVRQILVNVLAYSVQSAPEGGLVRMRLALDGKRVILSLTDNATEAVGGPVGDDPLSQFGQWPSMVMDPLSGSELRLPIALKLTRMLAGDLTLASTAEGGHSIEFWLPFEPLDGRAALTA